MFLRARERATASRGRIDGTRIPAHPHVKPYAATLRDFAQIPARLPTKNVSCLFTRLIERSQSQPQDSKSVDLACLNGHFVVHVFFLASQLQCK